MPTAPDSLSAWLSYLECLHPKGQAGIELGLDRVRRVSEALGQRPSFPVITVAGTNGKGSTCRFLETILDRAGYRVGAYTSPHLLSFNERVRIAGSPVEDSALCDAFARVDAARRAAGDVALTYFEFSTLAAWEVFSTAGLEAAILEVGLGGRLDAVNVYEPDAAVVTGIALDHLDYLGSTREEIGFEKAGIYRPGKPALCADPDPPASLLARAAAIGADLRLLGRDFGFSRQPEDRSQWWFWVVNENGVQRRTFAYPALRGAYQLQNASVALAALDSVRARLPVSMQAMRQGLIEAELAGRFQVIPGRPVVVLDVAHNPQAGAALVDNLANMGFHERTVAVVGMFADKDIAGTLSPLTSSVDHWLTVPLESPRAASPEAIEAILLSGSAELRVECCDSVVSALARAAELAGETDRIVVFGSFLTVAAALSALGRKC